MPERAELGVFGGSGFYRFLDDVVELDLDTPWGKPSAPVAVATLGDRRIAFIPRHGAHHELPPHRINCRANVWAMHSLGVRRIFAPCASGSLRPDIRPGDFVVCDQLVDRTSGRPDTFYDGPLTNHVTFAEPYCPSLRAAAVEAGRSLGITVHDRGTVVVIQGPRFSTRAESRWYAAMGWDVVNMTQHPEAVLARELGLCYASIALVTDWDAGLDGDPRVRPVTQSEVFGFLERNATRVRELLMEVLARVPATPDGCRCAADAAEVPPHLSDGTAPNGPSPV